MSWAGRQITRHKTTLQRASVRPAVPASFSCSSPSAAQHPVTAALDLRSRQQSWSPAKVASSGVHVVSQELCDDALNLLAPSLLETHRGCNIIDLFPGPGLWSRKIHDLLAPRSHVLVDSPQDACDTFLQPLLAQPGSRFRHLSVDQVLLTDKGFYDDVLAQLDNLPQRDSLNDEPNNDILVLANMTKLAKVRSNKEKQLRNADLRVSRSLSPAEPFVFDFLRHLQARTGPHSFGPARLLLWTLDRDKFNFLPRTIAGRQHTVLETDESFFLQEIVGSAAPVQSRRPAHMELQSAIQTAERMHFSGITLPSARRSLTHENILKNASFNSATPEDPTKNLRQMLSELNNLEIRWALDGFSLSRKSAPDDKRFTESTDEYRRMNELRALMESFVGEKHDADRKRIPDSIHRAVTTQALLNDLERAVASGKPDSLLIHPTTNPTSTTPFGPYTMADLSKRLADLSTRIGSARTTTWHRVSDDQSALTASPPLLAWDQRPFEPLNPTPTDFHPAHNLALLDFTPRPGLPASALISRAPLVRIMRPLDHLPIGAMLDHVAHGASAALLPRCATLSDPLAGGRLDLRNLRGRLLTYDMWRELVGVWSRWAFRKGDELLLADVGANFGEKNSFGPF